MMQNFGNFGRIDELKSLVESVEEKPLVEEKAPEANVRIPMLENDNFKKSDGAETESIALLECADAPKKDDGPEDDDGKKSGAAGTVKKNEKSKPVMGAEEENEEDPKPVMDGLGMSEGLKPQIKLNESEGDSVIVDESTKKNADKGYQEAMIEVKQAFDDMSNVYRGGKNKADTKNYDLDSSTFKEPIISDKPIKNIKIGW